MRAPPQTSAEDTPRRGRLRRGLAGLGLAASLACAGGAPTPPPIPEPAPPSPALRAEAERLAGVLAEAPPAPAGSVRVRLAFGAEVDLDLFVSDPQQETVYFANQKAASGGRLHQDERCGSPAPRIEVVEWTAPLPGRYRIGIDFPHACAADDGPQRAAYALSIEQGGERTLQRGVAELGVFVPIANRFDYRP